MFAFLSFQALCSADSIKSSLEDPTRSNEQVEKSPLSYGQLIERGDIYVRKGDSYLAMLDFEKALRACPDSN
ncbi:MAG: hypothetical protein K8F91_03990 [Candidatus Obscuribacterales bacterium]|nr:hypothetical protein [Candidatus Obscuribacterales bacterium]